MTLLVVIVPRSPRGCGDGGSVLGLSQNPRQGPQVCERLAGEPEVGGQRPPVTEPLPSGHEGGGRGSAPLFCDPGLVEQVCEDGGECELLLKSGAAGRTEEDAG